MTEREVLKLALEALENNKQKHHYCEDTWYSCPKHEDGCANEAEGDECNCGADEINAQFDKAITAIKEALAQPEQELLAWKNAALRVGEDLSSIGPNGYYNMTAQQWLDWAMAQQPRGNNSLAQPEQERCEYCKRGLKTMCLCGMKAQPEQEFVAYIDMSEWPPVRFKEGTLRCDIAHLDGQKLYITPPQRTWVGLTDEEIDQGLLRSDYAFKTAEAWRAGVVFAMTKLKQKNVYDS